METLIKLQEIIIIVVPSYVELYYSRHVQRSNQIYAFR